MIKDRLLRPLAGLILVLMLASAHAADSTPAITAASGTPAATAASASPWARTEVLHDIDPYYSSLALQVPLTNSPVPVGGQLSEAEVYRRLFLDSLRPRVLLLEASVYPLPVFGTWLKSNHPNTYNDFNVGTVNGNQLNVLDGVTAGFQEPWAISAFTGSTMRFTREDNGSAGNRGYMGYLVSFGTKHIYNNVLIDDNWWEMEWKLKGERDQGDEKLGWSFRIGVKNNGNSDIRDVFYVGMRRKNLDYRGTIFSFLDNTDLEILSEFDRSTFRFLRQEVTIGRTFPLQGHHMALGVDMGLIYQSAAQYSGALTDPTANTFTVVLRPDLEW